MGRVVPGDDPGNVANDAFGRGCFERGRHRRIEAVSRVPHKHRKSRDGARCRRPSIESTAVKAGCRDQSAENVGQAFVSGRASASGKQRRLAASFSRKERIVGRASPLAH